MHIREENPQARAHVELMHQKYGEEIQKSVKDSHIYGPDIPLHKDDGHPLVQLSTLDSAAALKLREGKTAILNFADYVMPGGKYIFGAKAQEEALCSISDLWNILNDPAFHDYFAWNKKNQNKYLYYHRALYTPDVIFEIPGYAAVKADVLSCAAPFKNRAGRYHHVTKEECMQVMKERILFIRNILELENTETCILGAYGCGVFGNPVAATAEQFAEVFQNTSIRKVIYALPQDSKRRIFANVFKNMKERKYVHLQ